jgi:hypothetical protein
MLIARHCSETRHHAAEAAPSTHSQYTQANKENKQQSKLYHHCYCDTNTMRTRLDFCTLTCLHLIMLLVYIPVVKCNSSVVKAKRRCGVGGVSTNTYMTYVYSYRCVHLLNHCHIACRMLHYSCMSMRAVQCSVELSSNCQTTAPAPTLLRDSMWYMYV